MNFNFIIIAKKQYNLVIIEYIYMLFRYIISVVYILYLENQVDFDSVHQLEELRIPVM